MSSTSQSEDQWNAYLKDRPELSKYYHRMIDLASVMSSQAKIDRFIKERMPKLDSLRYDIDHANNEETIPLGQDSFLITNRHDVLNMTDGEALAYVVDCRGMSNETSTLKHCSKTHLNADEAAFFIENRLEEDEEERGVYLHILCARIDHKPLDSQEVLNHARRARLMLVSSFDSHYFWDDKQTFAETACKYDHAEMLPVLEKNGGIYVDQHYLHTVMLADKPDPSEISEDEWQAMTAKLIDESNRKFEDKNGYQYFPTLPDVLYMGLPAFFGKGLNELVFLETIYDFMESVAPCDADYYYDYEEDLLKPTAFDLLREYGTSFAKPIFETEIEPVKVDYLQE